jgi:hypothetical protein
LQRALITGIGGQDGSYLAELLLGRATRSTASSGDSVGSPAIAWRVVMALRIVCMCGYVIQGGDDDELWANAQGHMGVLHPELVDSVTREDLLAQAELL